MDVSPPQKSPKKRRVRRAIIASALALTVTAGGGTAWALDRFVIDHVEIADVSAYEAGVTGPRRRHRRARRQSTGERDRRIRHRCSRRPPQPLPPPSSPTRPTRRRIPSITISTVVTGSGDSTVTYYVADVVVDRRDPVRSAFAENSFGENIIENTSDIAAGQQRGLRHQRRLLRFPGHRDRHPQRRGLPRRGRPAGAGVLPGRHRQGLRRDRNHRRPVGRRRRVEHPVVRPGVAGDGEIVAGIDDVEVDTNFGNHSIQGEQPRTAVGIIDRRTTACSWSSTGAAPATAPGSR